MDTDLEGKPLPVSTGSFGTIRREGLLYVDKTRRIASLLGPENKYLFLARPRRFGKTLLVSTLEALFQGQEDLFTETWISQSGWSWTPHKVIRLDMTAWRTRDAVFLEAALQRQMIRLFRKHRLARPDPDMGAEEMFSELIEQLAAASGRGAVVLIDEYDAPILQNLEHPETLRAIRDFLRGFYGILKARDEDLRLVLLTGVTRFARTSVFSGLNNLRDISSLPAYSDLTGFTEPELESCLGAHMDAMAHRLGCSRPALRDRLRAWYDGYLFAEGGTRVYNPFSALNCLANQRFGNYWAESGTPAFLTDLFARQRHALQDLLGLQADRILTATYDVTHPSLLSDRLPDHSGQGRRPPRNRHAQPRGGADLSAVPVGDLYARRTSHVPAAAPPRGGAAAAGLCGLPDRLQCAAATGPLRNPEPTRTVLPAASAPGVPAAGP